MVCSTDMRDPCHVPRTKQLKPNIDRRLKFRFKVTVSPHRKIMEDLDSLARQASCRLASKQSYHYLPFLPNSLGFHQSLAAR